MNNTSNKPWIPAKRSCSEELRFDVMSWGLLDRSKAVPGKNPIVLSSYILGDGLGDYNHLLKMTHLLSKKFHDRQITRIAVSAECHKGKLRSKEISNCSEHLAYSGNGKHLAPIINSSPFDNFDEILQIIKEADIWISGPIRIPTLFNSLEKEAKNKIFALNEYDFDGNDAKEFQQRIQLGLGTQSVGIFTNEKKSHYRWDKLESEFLKEYLFQSRDIQEDQIESYLDSHAVFMCYVSNMNFAFQFLAKALAFATKYNPGKNVDIIFPSKRELSEFKENPAFNQLLNLVHSIQFVSTQGSETLYSPNKDKTVQLRIINPGVLSKRDFKRVTFLSSPLVACTGNTSLGQALSYGKIPFYEKLSQTQETYKCLKEIAAKIHWDSKLSFEEKKQGSALVNFLETQRVSELAKPQIIEEAKRLGKWIKEQYSFNGPLRGMVNMQICRRTYPEFDAFIQGIKKKFLENELDLPTAAHEIQQKFTELDLL